MRTGKPYVYAPAPRLAWWARAGLGFNLGLQLYTLGAVVVGPAILQAHPQTQAVYSLIQFLVNLAACLGLVLTLPLLAWFYRVSANAHSFQRG